LAGLRHSCSETRCGLPRTVNSFSAVHVARSTSRSRPIGKWQYPGPASDLQPVVNPVFAASTPIMKNGVWFLRLGLRGQIDDSPRALWCIHAPVVTVTRELQQACILEPAVDARRDDPHRQPGSMQVLALAAALPGAPTLRCASHRRDHRDRQSTTIPRRSPPGDLQLEPVGLHVYARRDQRHPIPGASASKARSGSTARARRSDLWVSSTTAASTCSGTLTSSGDFFAQKLHHDLAPGLLRESTVRCRIRNREDGFCARYSPRSTNRGLLWCGNQFLAPGSGTPPLGASATLARPVPSPSTAPESGRTWAGHEK